MKSECVSLDVLLARWAFEEMASPRFSGHLPIGHRHLTELSLKALQGASFDSLLDPDILALATHLLARRAGLLKYIQGVRNFKLHHLGKHDLRSIYTIPQLRIAKDYPTRIVEFVSVLPPVGSDGAPVASDPRIAAIGGVYRPDRTSPIIVGVDDGDYILIDGYRRSIIFLRDASADARIRAWIPSGSPQR